MDMKMLIYLVLAE